MLLLQYFGYNFSICIVLVLMLQSLIDLQPCSKVHSFTICFIFAGMKIFAFIMAFMVLALSVMPCMDRSDTINGSTKTAFSKSDTQKEHSDSDDCSPFCTCSCCSASVFHQVLAFSHSQKPVFQIKKYPIYTPSFCSEISFSIWQPPKLA